MKKTFKSLGYSQRYFIEERKYKVRCQANSLIMYTAWQSKWQCNRTIKVTPQFSHMSSPQINDMRYTLNNVFANEF